MSRGLQIKLRRTLKKMTVLPSNFCSLHQVYSQTTQRSALWAKGNKPGAEGWDVDSDEIHWQVGRTPEKGQRPSTEWKAD